MLHIEVTVFVHIVMWNFSEPNKDENIQRAKAALMSMQGKIPGLTKIEVGINCVEAPTAMDICLYSVFTDQQAYEAYREHPEHEKVKPLFAECTDERKSINYKA